MVEREWIWRQTSRTEWGVFRSILVIVKWMGCFFLLSPKKKKKRERFSFCHYLEINDGLTIDQPIAPVAISEEAINIF